MKLSGYALAFVATTSLGFVMTGCKSESRASASSTRKPNPTEVGRPKAPPSGAKQRQPPRAGAGHKQLPDNVIVNLYDAFGKERAGLTHSFGFSALIRYQGKTILFDSGTSADILRRNVETLGLNLRSVDLAVASHSHFDHINGFDHVFTVHPKLPLYFPYDPFFGAPISFDVTGPSPRAGRSLPKELQYFGGAKTKFPFDRSGRFWKADVRYVPKHRTIGPGMHLIVTRSPYLGYFTRYPGPMPSAKAAGAGMKTIELPELSLVLETPQGLVIIVGCSHSLVDRIVAEARRHLKQQKVALVMGGYHLLPYKEDRIRKIANRMRTELSVQRVAPCHCTGHLGLKVFRELWGPKFHLAGLGATVPIPH